MRIPKIFPVILSGLLLISILIAIVLSSCDPSELITPEQTDKPYMLRTPSEPAVLTAMAIQIKAQPDVQYCAPDGKPLYLDTFYPLKAVQPRGMVIYIHGGGWTSGWKYEIYNIGFDLELLQRGYMIASINYRLAPEYQFRDMLEDVKCAVRYLRAHANTYQIDPNKIGVIGDSAGAYLAAMLGVTASESEFKTAGDAEWNEQDSRVKAVVMLYGPGDLSAMDFDRHEDALAGAFNVSSSTDPKLLESSPINYISQDDPPILIVQAKEDKVVPKDSAVNFQNRLQQAGVLNQLVLTNSGGFVWDIYSVQQPLDLERQQLVKSIGDFFDRYLAEVYIDSVN